MSNAATAAIVFCFAVLAIADAAVSTDGLGLCIRDCPCNQTRDSDVPCSAQGPPIPAVGYRVDSIGGGLYMIQNGAYISLFLIHSGGVVLIDAPPGLAAAIVAEVKGLTDKPVTQLIYSHNHVDHIGGAATVLAALGNKYTKLVAHELTIADLRKDNDSTRPWRRAIKFRKFYSFKLDDVTIECSYNGSNHVEGNIFVYIKTPLVKVVYLVDCIFPGWIPFEGDSVASNQDGFIAAPGIILGFDFDYFVAGHLNRLADRFDVEQAQEFVFDIVANAAAANQEVTIGPFFAQYGLFNPFQLLKAWYDAVTDKCVEKMAQTKWPSTLGGYSTYIRNACDRFTTVGRVDPANLSMD